MRNYCDIIIRQWYRQFILRKNIIVICLTVCTNHRYDIVLVYYIYGTNQINMTKNKKIILSYYDIRIMVFRKFEQIWYSSI